MADLIFVTELDALKKSFPAHYGFYLGHLLSKSFHFSLSRCTRIQKTQCLLGCIVLKQLKIHTE